MMVALEVDGYEDILLRHIPLLGGLHLVISTRNPSDQVNYRLVCGISKNTHVMPHRPFPPASLM